MGKDSQTIIYCDTSGCQNVSEWVDKHGYRYCDSCKQKETEMNKKLNLQVPIFRRRKGIISY